MKSLLKTASVSLAVLALASGTAFAQTATQFQSNGTTAIANGGTVTGASVVLSAALPANNDTFTSEAICPTNPPPRHIPDETESVDDWVFSGFEIKPVGTPLDGAGLTAASGVSGGTYKLTKSGLAPGTYHWVGHYTNTIGSITSFCDGRSLDTTRIVTGATAPLTFVIPAAAPTVTKVTVTCAPASVPTGATSNCTAAVTGTGAFSSAVTWTASRGTITAGGILTAPGTAGSVTVTATSVQTPAVKGTATVTVTAAAAPGTITVASRNSVSQTTPVSASWDFSAISDPCVITSNPCANVSNATYNSITAGTYKILPSLGSAGTHYAFNSVQENIIAQNKKTGVLENLFAFGNDLLIPTAHAFSFPSCNPDTQTVSGALGTCGQPAFTASFIILWDPIPGMSVTPTLSLTDTSPSKNISVSNIGSPGSSLKWTNPVITYGNGGGWLSVSPTSDATGIPGGSSDTVTVTANPASLAPGTTYTATITFNAGLSIPAAVPASDSVSVQFTSAVAPAVCGDGVVTAPETCDNGAANGVCPASCSTSCTSQACPPPPSCSFNADPSRIVLPEQSNLIYSCVHVTTCNLLGGQFGGSPGRVLTVTANTANGSIPVSPTKDTQYTLQCYGELPPPGSNLNYRQNVDVNVDVAGPTIHETN